MCEDGSVLRLATSLLFCIGLQGASALLESRAEGRFTLDGRGEAMLVDFRPDSVRGWKISKARLYLFVVSGAVLPKMPVSTVAVNWTEDAPSNARNGVFGNGASRHTECLVKPLRQGWVEVELPGEMIEAMAAGRSFGLAWLSGTMRVNGRSPAFRQPYLLVEGVTPK